MADVVLSFMDELKIDHANLIGHSLGGAISMKTAIAAPKRVSSVTVFGSAGLGSQVHMAGENFAYAAGVERGFLFQLYDDELGFGEYYGLVRNDGTPRPALQAAKLGYMSNGRMNAPMVLRVGCGTVRSTGPHHSGTYHPIWAHIPGLIVCMPSNPADAKGPGCVDPACFFTSVLNMPG